MNRVLCLFLYFVICITFVTGCATQKPMNVSYFSNAPSKEGYATLYIYRLEDEVGSAVWPEVYLNGNKAVALKNGAYSVLYVKPRKYTLTTEKSSFLSGLDNIPAMFEISENGVYYLKYESTDSPPKKGITVSNVKRELFQGGKVNYSRWVIFSRQEAIPEISYCYYIQPYSELF